MHQTKIEYVLKGVQEDQNPTKLRGQTDRNNTKTWQKY